MKLKLNELKNTNLKKVVLGVHIFLGTLTSMTIAHAETKDSPISVSLSSVNSEFYCKPEIASKGYFGDEKVNLPAEVVTEKSNARFSRTDTILESPEGKLKVEIKKNGEYTTVCSFDKKIELNLSGDIYYSEILKKFIIVNFSVSNQWYDIYSVENDECKFVGSTVNENDYSENTTAALRKILSDPSVVNASSSNDESGELSSGVDVPVCAK